MRNDLIENLKATRRRLESNWETAVAHWDDSTRARFDNEYWLELTRLHAQTHKEMNSLLETIASAQRYLKAQNTEL